MRHGEHLMDRGSKPEASEPGPLVLHGSISVMEQADNDWLNAERAALPMPKEFASVHDPCEGTTLLGGFAVGLAKGTAKNIEAMAAADPVKIAEDAGRACATAASYYANTDFGQVKQDAALGTNMLMTGLSGWMQNYNKLDAWHRGEAIGDLRSYVLPYGLRNAATAAEIATV